MIKAYQEMADLTKELAETDMAVVNEVWARHNGDRISPQSLALEG
jgi:hypothetical protein